MERGSSLARALVCGAIPMEIEMGIGCSLALWLFGRPKCRARKAAREKGPQSVTLGSHLHASQSLLRELVSSLRSCV